MITPAQREAALPRSPWALFLDVDGTLLELADTPGEVTVDPSLPPLLERLRVAADGAVALVSGRTIADVDHLLGTTHFAIAGLHGWERRDARGVLHTSPIDGERLAQVREDLRRLVRRHPELLLEDKGAGLAVHYLKAPEMEQDLLAHVQRLVAPLEPEFSILRGRAVIEVKPAWHTKGSAIAAFMQQTPFANRTPIVMGDDVTDYDGFAAVHPFEGLTIAVGPRVTAQYWLPGPAAVRGWLEQLLEAPSSRVRGDLWRLGGHEEAT